MATIDLQQVAIENDVIFGRGGERELLCDIYRPPAGLGKRTGLIHIHGGGFTGGGKERARTAPQLAARGYTCVSMQYRLAPEAKWPAQIEDVKACIRWCRANASRLEIEPEKLALLGYSAGSHLAIVAAGSPDLPEFEGTGGNEGAGTAVAACVSFYGPARRNPRKDGAEDALMGPNAGEAAYKAASPITYVEAGFPPTILLHGTADTQIAVEASFELYEAMRKAGVAVELHAIDGVDHIFDSYPEFAEVCAGWIDLFLDRHVVNPRTYPGSLAAAAPTAR